MYQQNENPWQNRDQSNYRRPPQRKPRNAMAQAALVCSLLSIVTICTFYGAIFFGALAIILALLSRGNNKKVTGPIKGNIILSVVAIVISIVIIVSTLAYVFTTFGGIDNFYDYYIETLEENGYSEEMLEQYGLIDDSDASGSDSTSGESGSEGDMMIEDQGTGEYL